MGKRELTRRQVLAGAVGAGGVGAAFGTGTGAILATDQVFRDSRFRSGTVDLEVEWETDDDSGSSEDGELSVPLEFAKQVPDSNGTPDWSGIPDDWKDEDGHWKDVLRDWQDEHGHGNHENQSESGTSGGGNNGTGSGNGNSGRWENIPDEWKDGNEDWKDVLENWKGENGNENDTIGSLEFGSETFDVTVSLPDLERENNPAFAWVGAHCPEGDLADELEVTIGYANCSGDNCVVFSGSLGELAGGRLLDADPDIGRGVFATGRNRRAGVRGRTGRERGQRRDRVPPRVRRQAVPEQRPGEPLPGRGRGLRAVDGNGDADADVTAGAGRCV
jgi:hypothetical protein